MTSSNVYAPWYWTDPATGLHAVSVVEVDPTETVIDLATAKLYARLSGTDLDPLFTTFIRTATAKVEVDTGLALPTQTRRIWFDRVPCGVITLPPCCEPVQTIEEFAYLDTAGVKTAADPSSYQLDSTSHPHRIAVTPVGTPSNLRAFQPATLQLVVGKATDAIDPTLVHAVGLLTGFYANASGDRFLADALYDQYEETIAPFRLVTV